MQADKYDRPLRDLFSEKAEASDNLRITSHLRQRWPCCTRNMNREREALEPLAIVLRALL